MEIYLIEVCDMEEQFRIIEKGIRGSLETAKSLVNELLQEFVRKDYTTTKGEIRRYEDGSMTQFWYAWCNHKEGHDYSILISSGGRMDTTEHRLWIPNEDEGKMFESNEEMTEYIINNYNL